MPTISGANAATKQELRDVSSITVFATFVANDTTPDVSLGGTFKTANTVATTISNFDNGYDGQRIIVVVNDNNTTLDFSASSLVGNNGNDLKLSNGDSFTAVRDNTGNWYVQVSGSIADGTNDNSLLAWNSTSGVWDEQTQVELNTAALFPPTPDTVACGTSSNYWSTVGTDIISLISGQVFSLVVTTGSAVGFTLDTQPLTAGDKLLSIVNGSTEKLYLDHDGNIFNKDGVQYFPITFDDNTGAVGIETFNLPAAIKGMAYVFERVASFAYRIDPNGTEYFAGSTAGKYKSLDSDGTYMKIECLKDGIWHVMASFGTITDE